MDFKLGDTVIDVVTDYTGMIIGISDWLWGCKTCGVQAKMDKDNKIGEVMWFDIGRLKLIEKETLKSSPKITGGPGNYKY